MCPLGCLHHHPHSGLLCGRIKIVFKLLAEAASDVPSGPVQYPQPRLLGPWV